MYIDYAELETDAQIAYTVSRLSLFGMCGTVQAAKVLKQRLNFCTMPTHQPPGTRQHLKEMSKDIYTIRLSA